MEENNYGIIHGENEARAAIMAPVLWKIFWLMVAANVLSLLSFVPATLRFATLFTQVAALLVGMLIITLQTVDRRFRTAGMFAATSAVLQLAGTLLGEDATTAMTLAASVCSLFAVFFEFNTMAVIVGQSDAQLGCRWKNLWKYRMIALCVSMASSLLVLVSPVMTTVVVMGVTFVVLVLGVMQMVYYYKTARLYDGMIVQ